MKRRWLALGLGSFVALATLAFWALRSPGVGSKPDFSGLTLKLRPARERIVSPLGAPFELGVQADVTAPEGNAGGEWQTEFSSSLDELLKDPSTRQRLRYGDAGRPSSDWARALVCVRPHALEVHVAGRLHFRGPGTSGLHDIDTGVEATTKISIQCEGPASPRCGDGQVTHDEECDSKDLREVELRIRRPNGHRVQSLCALLDKGSGTLRCGADCRYDTSACVIPASCGNGTIDPGEECDGNAKGDKSCGTEGFSIGELGCRSDCQLDVSGCKRIDL